MLILTRFLVLAWFLLVIHGLAFSYTAVDDKDTGRVVAEGYLKNREAYTQFSCHFKVVIGKALSQEQGLKGEFERVIEGEGIWLTDGEKTKFSVTTDLAKYRQLIFSKAYRTNGQAGAVQLISPIDTLCLLDDGSNMLHFEQTVGFIRVEDQTLRQPRLMHTPMDMGCMGKNETKNPAVIIGQHTNEKKHCVATTIMRNGEKLIAVECGDSPKEIYVKYCFDPQKGFSLVGFDGYFKQQKPVTVISVLDTRQTENGAWFPFHSRMVRKSIYREGEYEVRDIIVTRLDLTRPDAGKFYFNLPKGAPVSHDNIHFPYLQLEKEEKVTLESLSSLIKRAEEAKQKHKVGPNGHLYRKPIQPQSSQAAPDSSSTPWYKEPLTLSAFTALLITACYLRFRKSA